MLGSVQLIKFSILISVYLYLLALEKIMWEDPYVIDRFNLKSLITHKCDILYLFKFWILAHFEMQHAAISLMVLVLKKTNWFCSCYPLFWHISIGPSIWPNFLFWQPVVCLCQLYHSWLKHCLLYLLLRCINVFCIFNI